MSWIIGTYAARNHHKNTCCIPIPEHAGYLHADLVSVQRCGPRRFKMDRRTHEESRVMGHGQYLHKLTNACHLFGLVASLGAPSCWYPSLGSQLRNLDYCQASLSILYKNLWI